MKLETRFPKQVAATLGGAAVLLCYPLLRLGSAEVTTAVALGAILSTVNVLLGYLAIEYSFDKSYTTFLKAVLGGMGLRLLLLLGAMVVLIKLFAVQVAPFTISLLGFYAVFLVLEILFVQQKIVTRQQR